MPNKKILFLVGLLLFLLIILLLWPRRESRESTPFATPSENPFINQPVDEETIIIRSRVSRINPEGGTILTPGVFQLFQVSFTQPVEPKNLFVNLKAKDQITEETYRSIDFDLVYSELNSVLTIQTKEPTTPFTNYNLTIFSEDGTKLLQQTYISDRTSLPVKETNDPTLIQHLPHRTESYSLSYIPDKNIYVFSFSYNENSSESLDEQYETAKSAAIEFIRSKGINPDELKIEWRFH